MALATRHASGAGLSVVGNYREENQDAFRLPSHVPESALIDHGYLWGIADGMGGYAHGGIASNLALDVFFDAFYAASSGKAAAFKSAVQQANVAVQREAARLGMVRMGTTLTAVHLLGGRLSVTHIGDSRVYLVRGGQAVCLTQDHTQVGDLVRMKLLPPEKVRTHERRSHLNRAIGIQLFVQADITEHSIQPDDYLVLCTDGVWSVIEDDEFAQFVHAESEPERINERLIAEALARDSDDNASAITIHIREIPHESASAPTGKGWSLGKLFNKRRFAGM
ncbi:MAG: serine/threonine-protein phosphatase [Anaerolinea sp.]|nr:serine/threonine-protein phosphatase [Anaerolinea sp.]